PQGLIDWGTGQWYLSGPFEQLTANGVTFNGPPKDSASFVLTAPWRLVKLDVYNGGGRATQVKASCPGQSSVVITVAPQTSQTLSTGWTTSCSPVTLSSGAGWNTEFQNIVISNP